MKKKILVILVCVILLLSLTGCGISKKGNNSISLNLYNYSQYLNISAEKSFSGDVHTEGSSTYYPAFTTSVMVRGASTNFNYNDVKVVVEFSGEYNIHYKPLGWDRLKVKRNAEEFNNSIEVYCNIGGSGFNSYMEELDYGNYISNYNGLDEITYKLVSVSGSVTPVK